MPYINKVIVNPGEIQPLTARNQEERVGGLQQQNFANILKSAIKHVNEMEHQSNIATSKLATNNVEDLHEVMITAQKASITIEAAVQIQQKVIDAYNEMMRMQV